MIISLILALRLLLTLASGEICIHDESYDCDGPGSECEPLNCIAAVCILDEGACS